MRVRRREFLRRSGTSPDDGSACTAAEPATPSAADKRKAKLVQQLLEAATEPVGLRPAKRSKLSPGAPPDVASQPAATSAPEASAAAAPAEALTAATPQPQARHGLHLQAAAAPATEGQAIPRRRAASVVTAGSRHSLLTSLPRPSGGRDGAPSQPATSGEAPPAAPAPSTGTSPGAAFGPPALRRGADAVASKRNRSHPALRKSLRAPLTVGLTDPGAPAASSGRADSLWGRGCGGPTGPDSDDIEAGAKRARAATGTRRAWQPPQLSRGGRKRAHEPSVAGAAGQPRSPSGVRGMRRRTER